MMRMMRRYTEFQKGFSFSSWISAWLQTCVFFFFTFQLHVCANCVTLSNTTHKRLYAVYFFLPHLNACQIEENVSKICFWAILCSGNLLKAILVIMNINNFVKLLQFEVRFSAIKNVNMCKWSTKWVQYLSKCSNRFKNVSIQNPKIVCTQWK